MGAYSLLARRIGMRAAEDISVWQDPAGGPTAPIGHRRHTGQARARRRCSSGSPAPTSDATAHAAVYRARQLANPVTRAELDAIVETWVRYVALRIEDRDLKMMGRIVRAQMRRMAGEAVTDITVEALAASA